MPDELRADYNALEQISSQFNNQAQAIQAMEQKVKGSYQKLVDKGWIGQGANAFFEEMDSKIFPAQDRLHQALEEAGKATQQISQAVKQAEEQASSLFRQ